LDNTCNKPRQLVVALNSATVGEKTSEVFMIREGETQYHANPVRFAAPVKDLVVFHPKDAVIVGLDAPTGALRVISMDRFRDGGERLRLPDIDTQKDLCIERMAGLSGARPKDNSNYIGVSEEIDPYFQCSFGYQGQVGPVTAVGFAPVTREMKANRIIAASGLDKYLFSTVWELGGYRSRIYTLPADAYDAKPVGGISDITHRQSLFYLAGKFGTAVVYGSNEFGKDLLEAPRQ
jgi:hypothetical protein